MALLKPTISIVEEREKNGIIVLSIKRDFLEVPSSPLKDRIEGLVRGGSRHIVVDLRLFPEMDSADIGRLIRAHLAVREKRGQVHLCGLSPMVETLLKVTRLNTVFDIYPTDREAVAALSRSTAG